MIARLMLFSALLAGCAGDGGETDTDVDSDTQLQGCELRFNADTFELGQAAVGEDSDILVEVRSACGEDITLFFSWREPNTGVFTLPADQEGGANLVVPSGGEQLIRITFAPTEAVSYQEKLEITTDNVRVGGVVLTFRGAGT